MLNPNDKKFKEIALGVNAILGEVSPTNGKAWLFGSFARGEETNNSDVDILVEFDKNARVSLMKHAGMIVELENMLNRPIDLVVDGTLLPFAVESANRDRILIYERAS